MKKIFVILMAAALTVSMAAVAGAATTMAADAPIASVVLPIEDAEIIDDDTTQDQGGNNTFISIVDGYGCGNSSLNDKVIWTVDLEDDAASVSLLFGYGKDDGSVTTIDIDVDGEVVATMEVPFTGGWDITNAKWVTVPAVIPAGTHEVGFTFTSANSGSFSQVAFSGDYYLVLPIEDAEIVDDDTTQDQGGNNTFISIVDGYGCGNSSLNDTVIWTADFGANGADSIGLLFGYGKDDGSVTTLDVAVDSKDNVVGTFAIPFTGGWDIANADWCFIPVEIPAGEHEIYITFTSGNSGSFSQVAFTEADPAPVVEEVAGAPATFDAGVIAAACAIISAAGYAVSKKH